MTGPVVSRPAGVAIAEARRRPLYARVLGLRYLNPSGLMCFLFFEGTIAFALLLSLAELVTLWGVVVLPLSVATMVKINDVVAGAVQRSVARTPSQARTEVMRDRRARAIGRAAVPAAFAGRGAFAVRGAFATGDPLRSAVPALNAHPAEQVHGHGGRQRADHGESPESPSQRARQSGTARYE
ncbi:MAG TPA: hypothetical protein VGJ63_19460 [Micromonosporaceae bacterium]|jgi:hypothetical protein